MSSNLSSFGSKLTFSMKHGRTMSCKWIAMHYSVFHISIHPHDFCGNQITVFPRIVSCPWALSPQKKFSGKRPIMAIRHKNKVGYLIYWNLLLFFPASNSSFFTLPFFNTETEGGCLVREQFWGWNLKKSKIQLCFYVLWSLLAFFSVILKTGYKHGR